MPATIVTDLLLTYAVALVFLIVLARFRVPAVVAMLLAGACAGPGGLGIVASAQEVDALAEAGILLLLFSVGLDFSVTELRRLWRPVVVGGTLQVGVTALVVAVPLALSSLVEARSAVIIGLFVALSSTAIVVQSLASRNEIDAPHGKLAVGVLLFQDLLVVVLLLLVPILAGDRSAADVPWVVLRAAGALVLVGVLGWVVLPPCLRLAARVSPREGFVTAVLLASGGTAWLSARLGAGPALGAFLGGLVLAPSEVSHRVLAEVRPVKDLLGSLFFVSLGMLVDVRTLGPMLLPIAGLALLVMVLKTVVGVGALAVSGASLRVALTAALGLSQIGEFSFVLGRSGVEAGLLAPGHWQTLLSAAMLTMIAAPLVLKWAPEFATRVALRIGGRGRRPGGTAALGAPAGALPDSEHVVVLGYGLGGRMVSAALAGERIPFVVVELNIDTVRREQASGLPIVCGDVVGREMLEEVGVARARAVVILISDGVAAARAMRTTAELAPHVPVFVRTRYRLEADQFERAGAEVAVSGEVEASMEVLAELLARLGVSGERATEWRLRLRHSLERIDE